MQMASSILVEILSGLDGMIWSEPTDRRVQPPTYACVSLTGLTVVDR